MTGALDLDHDLFELAAALNASPLIDHWNGVTDTVEFVGQLRRV